MVDAGHVTKIRQMTWQPAEGKAMPVEVMTFKRFRRLNNGGTQRADFPVLALIETGHGSLSIDFATYPLTKRSVVLIGPGTVHRWEETAHLAGYLVSRV